MAKKLAFRSDPPSLKFHNQTDPKFYLSMVKAIMVIMDTWVTSSLANVMKPQPIFPKGQGYWCHIKNISIGITERKKKVQYTIKNISIGITEKRKKCNITRILHRLDLARKISQRWQLFNNNSVWILFWIFWQEKRLWNFSRILQAFWWTLSVSYNIPKEPLTEPSIQSLPLYLQNSSRGA